MMRIAVASRKGGTGKTFVSTHLYHTMVEAGLIVGVVDCDAEVPNAHLFLKGEPQQKWLVDAFCPTVNTDSCSWCGLCTEVCHFHAITCIPSLHYLKVMPDLCHACTACLEMCPSRAVLAGTRQIGQVTAYGHGANIHLLEARINEGVHSSVPVLREAIRHGEEMGWEYLIMDAPPGCACPFVNTVKDADWVFLVTEPTPFGLSDLKQTIQVLRQMNKPFSVIINRADLGDDQIKIYLAAEQIEVVLELPYSERIASAYSKGKLAVHEVPQLHQLFTRLKNKVLQYENSCS